MRTWFTELQPQQQPRANMTSPVMPNARQGCSAHTHMYKRLVSTAAQHQPHTQETYPIVLPNLCRCHNATREPHQRPPGEGCDAHSHVQVLVLVRARPISFHKHLPAAAPHFAPGHWLESARPATRSTDMQQQQHTRVSAAISSPLVCPLHDALRWILGRRLVGGSARDPGRHKVEACRDGDASHEHAIASPVQASLLASNNGNPQTQSLQPRKPHKPALT